MGLKACQAARMPAGCFFSLLSDSETEVDHVEKTTIKLKNVRMSGGKWLVEAVIKVPEDVRPTDDSDGDNQYYWEFKIQLDTGYELVLPAPVFKVRQPLLIKKNPRLSCSSAPNEEKKSVVS